MCFGKSGSYCTGDHGGGNHLTYSIDSYHQAAADDNVMATHQIFNIFSISEQSYKCCHKEQREGDAIHFILPRAVGEVVDRAIPLKQLEEVARDLR